MQRAVHHVGIEMASHAGSDLHSRNAVAADTLSIVLGLQIAFNDGDADIGRQALDGRLE